MCPRLLLLLVVLIGAAGCRGAGAVRYYPAEGALGPYSAAASTGDVLYLSGQIGRERGGTFEQEVRSAIDALETELERCGVGLGDILAVTVYLTDMERYAEFNEIYGRRLPTPYPARACVAVAALPAGARVELQATARTRY